MIKNILVPCLGTIVFWSFFMFAAQVNAFNEINIGYGYAFPLKDFESAETDFPPEGIAQNGKEFSIDYRTTLLRDLYWGGRGHFSTFRGNKEPVENYLANTAESFEEVDISNWHLFSIALTLGYKYQSDNYELDGQIGFGPHTTLFPSIESNFTSEDGSHSMSIERTGDISWAGFVSFSPRLTIRSFSIGPEINILLTGHDFGEGIIESDFEEIDNQYDPAISTLNTKIVAGLKF